MPYRGVIIEESLEDTSVLRDVQILSTQVEQVTAKHATPWLKQWTLHTVEVLENQADAIAKKLSAALETAHPWYADFKNDTTHFVIFRGKVFKIDRTSKEQYAAATRYGVSLGIPEYQVDFEPIAKE